jgi:outer membrane protein OmpA-like peptidoglycan-associated protein
MATEPTGDEPRRGIFLPIAVTLVGLAAIGVAEDVPVRHSVEHKLTTNSSNALRRAGVPFSNVRFVGRDGTVTVPSADAGTQAVAVVRHVDGVRVVDVVVLGQPGTGGTPITASPTPSVSVTALPSNPPSTQPSPANTVSASPTTGPVPTPSTSGAAADTPSSAPSPSATATPAPAPSPSPTTASTQSAAPTQSAASVQKQLNAVGEITFPSGSTTLTGRDKTIVGKVAAILKANPNVKIRLQGDTDSIGPAAFNLTVSRLRAHAVANALHALGVATDRMTVVGYGETRPKAPNDSAPHRAINRRVDLVAE